MNNDNPYELPQHKLDLMYEMRTQWTSLQRIAKAIRVAPHIVKEYIFTIYNPPRKSNVRVDEYIVDWIIGLYNRDWGRDEIAEEFNVSVGSVNNYIRKYELWQM